MRFPLATVPSQSKERRASTSVDTYPGTILEISAPKFTASLSCWHPKKVLFKIQKKCGPQRQSIFHDLHSMRIFLTYDTQKYSPR
mmetsp:Transcript_31334/g.47601  ORF Transcript_31334/g.47601 Transcript_31334/m.47601 type:complete len:85 (+) Transcript_31334:532-786(+)